VPLERLDDMASKLMLVYYTNPNPALLYTEAKTHLGHFRVARWNIDKNIYRFKIIEEFINESEVLFADYGNSERMLTKHRQ
jgi:hypothetical protein